MKEDLKNPIEQLQKENSQLKTILNNIDAVVYVAELKSYDLIFQNKKSIKLHGNKIGEKCYNAFQNIDMPCDFCTNNKLINDDGEPNEIYVWESQNSITKQWYQCRDQAIQWTDGRLVRLEIAIDISDRKKAEKSIKEGEIKFKTFAEQSPNMIFINQRGRVKYANIQCKEIMGYSIDEFYSKNFDFRSLIAPEYKELVENNFRRNMQGEKLAPYEYELITKYGKRISVIINSKLIDYEGNKAVLGVITDITEWKQAEKQIQRNLEFQELVSEIASDFVGVIDIHLAINSLLKKIGEFCKASRAYVFRLNDDEVTMNNTHEWCAKNIEPQIKNLQNQNSTQFPWWLTKFRNNEVVLIYDVSKLPAEAAAEKSMLEAQNIKSLIVLPINIAGKLVGFIGFDKTDETITIADEYVQVLSTSASILANSIHSFETENELIESAEKYRAIFENKGTATGIFGEDKIIKTCNAKFVEIYGYTKEELIGKKKWTDLVAPEDIERLTKYHHQRSDKTGNPPDQYEFGILNKNGEKRICTLNIGMVGSDRIVSLIDITEQKQAKQQLQKSIEEVTSLNKLGRDVNEAMTVAQVVNSAIENLVKMFDPDLAMFFILKDQELYARGEYFKNSNVAYAGVPIHKVGECLCGIAVSEQKAVFSSNIHKDKRCTWDECKIAGMTSFAGIPLIIGGKVIGIIGIGTANTRDFSQQSIFLGAVSNQITIGLQSALYNEKLNEYATELEQEVSSRIKAEKSLQENEKHLKELNASKDKFFSIIAHDLKGPFNTIIGFLEVIVNDYDSHTENEKKEYLKIVYSQIRNVFNLADNLLTWSRSQTKKIQFNPVVFDLRNLANDNIKLLKGMACKKSISIISHISDSIVVKGDETMVNTIIRNLLSNAIKFTEKGGNINIGISESTDMKLTVFVKDSGVGIKEEHLVNLFSIRENLSTKGTENEKGTGLGLVLCKEFINKHHEEIWVESEVGKGSTFFFTLPIEKL